MDTIAFLLVTGAAGTFMVYAFARFYLEMGSLGHAVPLARPPAAPATKLSRQRRAASPRLRTHTAPL
jgi:hypothetical protein